MIADFLGQSLRITHRGRVYTVHPPTVRGLLVFLGLFPQEVRALSRVGVPDDPMSLLVLFQGDRWHRVLSMQTEATEDELKADADLVRTLTSALISIIDLDRIASFFSGGSEEGAGGVEAAPPPAAVDRWSVAFVRIGQEFHVPPHTVADWPVTAYIETVEVLLAMQKGDDKPKPWVGEHNAPAGVTVQNHGR